MNEKHYEDRIIKDTIRLINIPSVIDESTSSKTTPFGLSINQCLDETLLICDELGMSTYKDPNGYYGYAEIGNHEEYIGIMCHLDVVPAGDLSIWETDPFQGVVKNGEIYGRGIGDDKGPTVSAIYAVKALLDEKVELKRNIRLIFLTDEETLWRCVDVYKEKEKEPVFAIAADGYFPYTYAEKGLLQMDLLCDPSEFKDIITGGANYNSVASNALYFGRHKEALTEYCKKHQLDYTLKEDYFEVIGVPSHSSKPTLGRNAILHLADFLKQTGNNDRYIEMLTEVFHYEQSKNKLFKEKIKDLSGEITINIGAIEIKEQMKIKLDLRIPVTYNKEDIFNEIKEKVNLYGFKVREHSFLSSLYVERSNPFIQVLDRSYREVSNDYETEPFIGGGATFARAYPDKAVCFGVKFVPEPSYAHEPNERIKIEFLVKGMKVYFEALKELQKTNL